MMCRCAWSNSFVEFWRRISCHYYYYYYYFVTIASKGPNNSIKSNITTTNNRMIRLGQCDVVWDISQFPIHNVDPQKYINPSAIVLTENFGPTISEKPFSVPGVRYLKYDCRWRRPFFLGVSRCESYILKSLHPNPY